MIYRDVSRPTINFPAYTDIVFRVVMLLAHNWDSDHTFPTLYSLDILTKKTPGISEKAKHCIQLGMHPQIQQVQTDSTALIKVRVHRNAGVLLDSDVRRQIQISDIALRISQASTTRDTARCDNASYTSQISSPESKMTLWRLSSAASRTPQKCNQ